MEDNFDVWERRKKTTIQMPRKPCPVSQDPWDRHSAVHQISVALLDMWCHCISLPIVVRFALSNNVCQLWEETLKSNALFILLSPPRHGTKQCSRQ